RPFFDPFGAVNTPENMDAYLASSFTAAKQATELADPAVVFLIAELEGPVGYAQLRAGAAPAVVVGARPIELVRLYAVKSWIGRGVGRTLMRSCLHEAGTRSHDAIWLGVWEHNQRARTFYRRWGFADVGTHIFQLGNDPQTDILMQRRLNPDFE